MHCPNDEMGAPFDIQQMVNDLATKHALNEAERESFSHAVLLVMLAMGEGHQALCEEYEWSGALSRGVLDLFDGGEDNDFQVFFESLSPEELDMIDNRAMDNAEQYFAKIHLIIEQYPRVREALLEFVRSETWCVEIVN